MATISDTMDPKDLVDFIADLSLDLETSEQVASYTMTASAEMAALGVSIVTASPRAESLQAGNTQILFWLQVDPTYQSNPAFDGEGTLFGISISFTTNVVVPRTKHRTLGIRIQQK
jgi:hypothetical protein